MSEEAWLSAKCTRSAAAESNKGERGEQSALEIKTVVATPVSVVGACLGQPPATSPRPSRIAE
jgi:hypothetical protein